VKEILRYYADTEVYSIAVNIECPYCGAEWQEIDKTDCGESYELECEDGCGKKFIMHFDAS
jgi:hypothetical protein